MAKDEREETSRGSAPTPEVETDRDAEARWRELALRGKLDRGEALEADAFEFLRQREREREESLEQGRR